MAQKLTIAQGLRALKRMRGDLANVRGRLANSSSWQKGKKPEYPFSECLKRQQELTAEFTHLHSRLLRANATNTVSFDGQDIPLCEALLILNEIKGEIAIFSSLDLREGKMEREPRYNIHSGGAIPSEPIIFERAISERERDDSIEELKQRFERLNDAVETVNHTTLLPD